MTCLRFRTLPLHRLPVLRLFLIFLSALLFTPQFARSQTPGPTPDLTDLTLEELMTITVTSAAKKSEMLSETAGAVFVITQEDIRRSGATHIPEVLRMVPGVEVARQDSNKWAVSIRGFNDLFARKLLVLIDGRSVYTGLFSGTFWDTQDTPLEDIERIEVIRGPGATLWGVNAVNGVINIITKHAGKTQGTLVSGGTGTLEQGFTTLRYGGKTENQINYRVYGKYFTRDRFRTTSGIPGNDDWYQGRGGFRMDWDGSQKNRFTLQGDAYGGDTESQTVAFRGIGIPQTPRDENDSVRGGNFLGRWTRATNQGSELQVQFYYNREDRSNPQFGQKIDTWDLDVQHRSQWAERHEVIIGANYRLVADQLRNTVGITFTPDSQTNQYINGFLQDQITLIPGTLKFTIGSKIGTNTFTGLEVQPSGRLLWTPHPNHTVWAAVSRAVRTPSRLEDEVRIRFATFTVPPTFVLALDGNNNLESENLLAYELGYRAQITPKLFVDVATFFNQYDDLVSSEAMSGQFVAAPTPHLLVPTQFQNQLSGEAYGVEIAATYEAMKFWKLKTGFTWFELDLFRDPLSTDTAQRARRGNSPQYQFNARSYINLPHNLEFDQALNYVDRIPGLGVEAYVRLDLRLGWKPVKNWEFSVVGQNLLESRHLEWMAGSGGGVNVLVPRGVYGKITWYYE